MGSSGMKRKGRSHLPKAGTRPANERELQARRAEALHPFSSDPWRRHGATYTISSDPWRRHGATYTIVAIIVAAVVVTIGVVALIAAT